MPASFTIVGIGEALFDEFPGSSRLGGAPLNVAVHAHRLASARGGQGVVVSRVGQDDLGQRLLDELAALGITTSYIQTDPDRATGRVYVDLDPEGQPSYDIVEGVAWDNLQFDFDLEDLAATCDAVCFGTLAQRDGQTRNAIHRFLDTTRRAVRLFDVNLRQHYFDARTLRRSCEAATVVKLNEDELPRVAREVGLPPASDDDFLADQLRLAFNLETVILTRGRRGTTLFTTQGPVAGEPADYPPAPGADSVGAGDACAAGYLVGRLLRLPLQQVANLANRMGAFVAAQPGATPPLPEELLQTLPGPSRA